MAPHREGVTSGGDRPALEQTIALEGVVPNQRVLAGLAEDALVVVVVDAHASNNHHLAGSVR